MSALETIMGLFRPRTSLAQKPIEVSVREEGTNVYVLGLPDGRQFVGSGTVWHDIDTGQRASTAVESFLSDKLALYKMREKGIVRRDMTNQPKV